MPILTIFENTDFEGVDDITNIDDIKTSYKLLYNLNQATLRMSQATSLDELYHIAVVSAVELLEIDRIGILLIDKQQKEIKGTWGTDEKGNVRSEHDQTSPVIEGFSEIIQLINNQGKVCIWEDQPLYEFDPHSDGTIVVGQGWNGAIALWEKQQLIGWIAYDNLINQRPFKPYIAHILRLFGSVISEYRLRFLAYQRVENLNKTLEITVKERTNELVEAQDKLQKANQSLELKVQQRTHSLQEKNLQLANTIAQLKSTQIELDSVQAHGAMNDLVVGVAHEVNTPLGCAITAASHFPYLLTEIQSHIDSNQLQDLPSLLNNAQEVSQLVQRNLATASSLISEFKRLSTLDIESLPAEKVNLKTWLNNTIMTARTYEADIKKLHIYTTIQTSCEEIMVQPEIFVQIFQELLLNAYLHGSDNTDKKVQIKVNISNQTLLIHFEDNGNNISKTMQKRIFTPFVTTQRNNGHKGLGLNITFNLIHYLLKGNLTYFDSEFGGAGFLISCPLTMPEE